MNKYHAVKTDGFDSKKEAEHFRTLMVQRYAKEPHQQVTEIEVQPRFDITVNGILCAKYYADFRVTYADKRVEIVDCKGFRTPVYILKKKLVEAIHGIKIIEV